MGIQHSVDISLVYSYVFACVFMCVLRVCIHACMHACINTYSTHKRAYRCTQTQAGCTLAGCYDCDVCVAAKNAVPDQACSNTCWLRNSFCVAALCHVDEWVRPLVTVDRLEGPVTISGAVALRDPAGMASSAIFSADSAGQQQSAAMWSFSDQSLSLYIADQALAGRAYTIELQLQNPLAAQISPPVTVQLDNGLSVAPVLMDKNESESDAERRPLFIYAIKFTYARVGQLGLGHPFSVNTLGVTIATNQEVQKGSKIRIAPFSGVSMTDIPEYDPVTSRLSLGGPHKDSFSAEKCSSACLTGTANFNLVGKSLEVFTAVKMQANSNLSFTFPVRNPGMQQESPRMGIRITFTDDTTDPPRVEELPTTAMVRDDGDRAPLKVGGAQISTKRIGQTVPYPGALNNIAVTVSFNVPVPAAAAAKLVISGLQGVQLLAAMGDGTFQVRDISADLNCSGLARGADGLGCEAFGIRDSGGVSAQCRVRWDAEASALEAHILHDLAQHTEYGFVFTVTNPAQEHQALTPKIKMHGKMPILAEVSMDVDSETDLFDMRTGIATCDACAAALPQWSRWAGRIVAAGGGTSLGLFPSRASAADARPLQVASALADRD